MIKNNPYANLSEDQLFALMEGLRDEAMALVNEDAVMSTAETDPETWEKMRKAFGN